MTIIKLSPQESGQHTLESQSHRTACWMDGWIAVPEELESDVWDCMGYCDLIIEDGVLTDITPRERPEPQEQTEPTQLDRIEAQAAYTAMMTDTLLPEVTV